MNTASPDDIDISAIWRSLRRSLPVLLIVSIILGGAAFGVLSVIKPRYTSEAQLQVVPPKPEAGSGNAASSSDAVAARLDKEAINTHLRAIMSPDLAEEIIADEKLADRPEFNPSLQPPGLVEKITDMLGLGGSNASTDDRVLKAYYDRLSVYSPRESRFIGIQFTSQDPELAAEVANRIASTYRSSLATRSAAETDEMQKVLQPKIDKLMKEVGDAEAAVENFRAQANIFKGGSNNTGLNEQRLAELNAELTKAQADRNQAEAHAQSARDMVEAGNAEALPDVQKSPLIQNLVQQRVRLERQLSELSATLLPGHPRMRQLRADLSGLERQINSEVKKVIDGIEKNAKVAAMREAAVEKSLQDQKNHVVSSGGDEVKLRQLEATAKSKRAELERLQTRYEANRARADSRAVPIDAQIISKARPSSIPSFPRKLPYAGLVAAAVLLFGIAIVVTRALFSAARSGSTQKAVWAPTASAVARGEGKTAVGLDQEADGVVHTVNSVEGLARHLLVRPPDIGGFRTLITGETDAIDSGNDAVELAGVLATSGADVVLIDWSEDGHGVAESMGTQTRPGIVELLQGKARFEDVVTRVPGSSAHLIPSGGAASDPDGLLDPDKVNLALDALDTAYDHIIVVGRTQVARKLFETIQGRFDAGVIVVEGKRRAARTIDEPGMFLGFQVTDIELLRLERPFSSQLAQERLARLTAKGGGQAGLEARSA